MPVHRSLPPDWLRQRKNTVSRKKLMRLEIRRTEAPTCSAASK